MTIVDKTRVLEQLSSFQPLLLELGCGNRKRLPASVGIDVLDYEAVDIVGDVFEVLAHFPNASVDAVASHHFIEHIPDLTRLLTELARILKPNGKIDFVAPHFSNPYFYSDCTHKSCFGLYTFCYFSANSYFKRKVPTYQKQLQYEIMQVDLVFKSPPPFYFRYGFKKLLGFLFNLNTYTQEFYEENLCYLFPCYEIKYRLRRVCEKSVSDSVSDF